MKKLKCPEGGVTYKIPGQDPIFADPEFKALLDPLSPQELGALEQNLIADGRALDPVVVWQETRIILDGHNRTAICAERDLPYKLVMKKFPVTPEGREQAMQWAIDHQFGRRNLSAEARAKLVEWRRARVAAAHQAGESNRAIADKEKVTEKTVRRDIAASGAAQESPEKVTGKDGKEYGRSRAERVGQKPVPTFVPKGERMAGDDTEAEKAARLERRSDPKQGRPVFDWNAFNREFANIMLWVDKLGKSCPGKHHQGPAATNLRSDLLTWKNRFKEWGRAITKSEPIPDVVDKVKRGRGRPKKGES